MKTKIAILGANYQYLSFYKQTKKLGYKIYSFGRAKDDHICFQYADYVYDMDIVKDKDKILNICQQEHIDGVTSFLLERAVPSVYYISRGLNIPCNSKECERLTENKYTMRNRMKECNVQIPQYMAINSRDEKIDIKLPVIVKPSDNGGSRGITLVREKEDLQFAIDRAFEWSYKKQVLVEQFIEGREFSIESISYQGKHYILQITDKITTGSPYFVELAHHQPATLTKEQQLAIKDLTSNMLNALKIEYGASHTEIKMDKNGIPYVIEMGPRMGGDYISSDLVRLSTGYDFVKGVLEVATNTFEEPIIGQQYYAGVYFLCKETEKKVLPYIQNKGLHKEIIYADIWGDIKEVQCNSDRGGYFIYQSDKKMIINAK